MLVATFTWGDLWRLALAVFLLAVGLSLAYLLVRLGGTVGRLSAFISGAEREVLPAARCAGRTTVGAGPRPGGDDDHSDSDRRPARWQHVALHGGIELSRYHATQR